MREKERSVFRGFSFLGFLCNGLEIQGRIVSHRGCGLHMGGIRRSHTGESLALIESFL